MIIFILILAAFNQIVFCERSERYMKLYNIACEPNPKWAVNVTCELKVLGREHVVSNMEMDLANTLRNISINLTLYKFYNQFRPFLINVHFNVCDILNNKIISNFYANTFIRIVRKYSNAVMCPLPVSSFLLYFHSKNLLFSKKNHLYVRRLEIKNEYMKMILDEGKYRFNVKFYEDYPKEYIGSIIVFGEIVRNYRINRNHTSKS